MRAIKVILLVACLAGIASAASMSSGSLSRHPLNQLISMISDHPPVCEECIEIVTVWKANADKMEKEWKADCMAETDPDERGLCLAEMKRFFQMLRTLTPEQFCQKVLICPQNGTASRLPLRAMDKLRLNVGGNYSDHPPVCEECIEIVTVWKANADKMEKEWKADCMAETDPDERGLCLAEMKRFFQMLRTLTPEQFCQKVLICPKKSFPFGLAL